MTMKKTIVKNLVTIAISLAMVIQPSTIFANEQNPSNSIMVSSNSDETVSTVDQSQKNNSSSSSNSEDITSTVDNGQLIEDSSPSSNEDIASTNSDSIINDEELSLYNEQNSQEDIVTYETSTDSVDSNGGTFLGNVIQNPQIQYSEGDSTIPGWSITATTEIRLGTTVDLKLNSTAVNGRRSLVGGAVGPILPTDYPDLFFSSSNDSNDFFMADINGTLGQTFSMISQTVEGLTVGEEYIFNLEYKLSGSSKLFAVVYPGTASAGTGSLTSTTFTTNTDDYVTSNIPFTATSSQATVSFRNYF